MAKVIRSQFGRIADYAGCEAECSYCTSGFEIEGNEHHSVEMGSEKTIRRYDIEPIGFAIFGEKRWKADIQEEILLRLNCPACGHSTLFHTGKFIVRTVNSNNIEY